MKDFIDKTSENAGTPLNREAMFAVQGFEAKTTVFEADGSILETNTNGDTKRTVFNADGSISEIFTASAVVTKKTTFKDNAIEEMLL